MLIGAVQFLSGVFHAQYRLQIYMFDLIFQQIYITLSKKEPLFSGGQEYSELHAVEKAALLSLLSVNSLACLIQYAG